jgi:hypothetical protein
MAVVDGVVLYRQVGPGRCKVIGFTALSQRLNPDPLRLLEDIGSLVLARESSPCTRYY